MTLVRARRQMALLLAMLLLPFMVIVIFNQPVDTRLERTLVQQLAELRERVQHAEMTNRERRRDVMILNQQIDSYNGNRVSLPPPRRAGNGSAAAPASAAPLAFRQELNPDLEVPGLLSYLPHLLGRPHALTPRLRVSRGRRDVTLVMGLPTVKRQVQNYLVSTLKNLIECMNEEERAQTLIVVFIAETDAEYCRRTSQQLQDKFPDEVDAGLLEIIAPSPEYYPSRGAVRRTLDDPLERVQWRTKQNLDFAYLMMYCRPRGILYVQLEDDIMTKPGYVTKMKEFALQKTAEKKDWFVLDFCQLGFIGKLFKTVELLPLIHFLVMFNNDKPSDWLLINLVQTKVCRFDKSSKKCKEEKDKVWLHYKPSLFQHIGTHSSLKGKVQKLKDKQFGKVQMFRAHSNPPAEVTSDMKPHKQYTLQRAYLGETYFWGLLPHSGDHLQFKLTPPMRLTGYLFQSGNIEHPSDKFYNTTVEIEPTYKPGELMKKYKSTADGFVIVGQFNDLGVASGDLELEWGPISAVRLAVQSESDNWAILSEIYLRTS